MTIIGFNIEILDKQIRYFFQCYHYNLIPVNGANFNYGWTQHRFSLLSPIHGANQQITQPKI